MATMLLFSDAITNNYKETSEAISAIGYKKVPPKKTLRNIMQQSFFHGASRFGTNFIA